MQPIKPKVSHNYKSRSKHRNMQIPIPISMPLRLPFANFGILLFGSLPRKRNLVIRVWRPPKLDRNLDSQLPIVDDHRCEHHDECERGVGHEEGENVPHMGLPCLTPHEAEDD
jgi:hypothetical protein